MHIHTYNSYQSGTEGQSGTALQYPTSLTLHPVTHYSPHL